eukprot:7639574-Pyramimonas_sp.AAC.1
MGSEDPATSPMHRRSMRLDVQLDLLHIDVADAQPTSTMHRRCIGGASPMHRRRIGDAARSSDPTCSDPVWEASIEGEAPPRS